jgi:MoxR-like ATPase
MTSADVASLAERMSDEIQKVIVGKDDAVHQALVGLLAGGHLLIEDIPGVGKTMLARSTAAAIGGVFRRVQFTPDLLPADVTGTAIYDQRSAEFHFRKGPVFANVVLADEINRATPKLQSALLECMEEGQVTVDGQTHALPDPFMVIATENPVEFRGTHPLPETQLDRFLLRVRIGYPGHDAEVEMLRRQSVRHPVEDVKSVTTPEEICAACRAVREVHVDAQVEDYIVRIAEATRDHPEIPLGASPRGSIALHRAAQARAAILGRDHVLPDDVKQLAPPCLLHRMVMGGISADASLALLNHILSSVRVP